MVLLVFRAVEHVMRFGRKASKGIIFRSPRQIPSWAQIIPISLLSMDWNRALEHVKPNWYITVG